MTEKSQFFTQNTLIPVGLVITLLAAAASVGVMGQKIEEVTSAIKDLRVEMKEIRSVGSTTIYSDYDSMRDFCSKFVRTI